MSAGRLDAKNAARGLYGKPRRSEIEVAADACIALVEASLLPPNPEVLVRIARAVDVPVTELRDAWRRRNAGQNRPPSTRRVAEGAGPAPPTSTPPEAA